MHILNKRLIFPCPLLEYTCLSKLQVAIIEDAEMWKEVLFIKFTEQYVHFQENCI